MYFKADADWNLVPCRDVLDWARWYETANRTVLADEVQGVLVSTVFLGLAHPNNHLDGSFDCGFLFETMVFGADGLLEELSRESGEDITSLFAKVFGMADVQRRYRTVAEAREGHRALLGLVHRALVRRG